MNKLTELEAFEAVSGAVGGLSRLVDLKILRSAVRKLATSDRFWNVLADWHKHMPNSVAVVYLSSTVDCPSCGHSIGEAIDKRLGKIE